MKYDAFIEAITEIFKLSKISPKLSTTSITNGSNNEEKKYEKHLKVLKGYFMDDEVIKSSRMSMISTFEQYKSAIGTFINKFYHSETRFIADFFRSPLYQVLISYYGEINIRLHTYFNCCARCRSFITDGFYVKLKEDMKDSSSVKMVVSFNVPYPPPQGCNFNPSDLTVDDKSVFFTQVPSPTA